MTTKMKTLAEVMNHIEVSIGPPPGDFTKIPVLDSGASCELEIRQRLAVFSDVEELDDSNYDVASILRLRNETESVNLMLSSMGKYACIERQQGPSSWTLLDISSTNLSQFEGKILSVVKVFGYVFLSPKELGQPTSYLSTDWVEDEDGAMQICHILFSRSPSWFNLDEFKAQ
jgi:hypothetical protein